MSTMQLSVRATRITPGRLAYYPVCDRCGIDIPELRTKRPYTKCKDCRSLARYEERMEAAE